MGGIKVEFTDEQNVPYTVERFSADPEEARKFMELIESNSRGYIVDWRGWSDDEVRYEASYRLHLIEQDLIQAHYLREKNKLQ